MDFMPEQKWSHFEFQVSKCTELCKCNPLSLKYLKYVSYLINALCTICDVHRMFIRNYFSHQCVCVFVVNIESLV